MKLDKPHDELALHLMGAGRVEEVRSADGALIGHIVDDELDMSEYPAAAKLAEAERATRKPPEPPLTNDEIAALRKLLSA